MKKSDKAKSMPAKSKDTYIVQTGLNYGDPERRAEPSEEVNDLPAESISWLLELGVIKPKEGAEQ